MNLSLKMLLTKLRLDISHFHILIIYHFIYLYTLQDKIKGKKARFKAIFFQPVRNKIFFIMNFHDVS